VELLAQIQNALERDDGTARRFPHPPVRHNRCDLKLELSPAVRRALRELLRKLRPTLTAVLGHDAELVGLSAVLSEFGAARQPIHADTAYREGGGVAILTTFVALQPIDESMGPTQFLPGTHTADAHAALRETEALLLESTPKVSALLGTGDATLFDSRVLHCGGANTSPERKRRVLFYVSFKARREEAPPRTLLDGLRGRHSLGQPEDEWLGTESAEGGFAFLARYSLSGGGGEDVADN